MWSPTITNNHDSRVLFSPASAIRSAIARRASRIADFSSNSLKAQFASCTQACSSKASCAGCIEASSSSPFFAYEISCSRARSQFFINSAIRSRTTPGRLSNSADAAKKKHPPANTPLSTCRGPSPRPPVAAPPSTRNAQRSRSCSSSFRQPAAQSTPLPAPRPKQCPPPPAESPAGCFPPPPFYSELRFHSTTVLYIARPYNI